MFREAIKISNKVFQVTAFELPALAGTEDVVPTLKFIAYEPRTQVQVGVCIMDTNSLIFDEEGEHTLLGFQTPRYMKINRKDHFQIFAT